MDAITGPAYPAERRMPLVRSLVTAFLVLALAVSIGPIRVQAAPATSGRAALVIANAAYPDADAPLAAPLGDGRAVTDALKARGFAIEEGQNLAKDAMQAAIDRFLRSVEPDGIALVFFSGYGIQVGRKNYLIPVDARIWSEADVARDGIAIDAILDDLAKRRVGIRVIVLDASRRNPFERRFRSFSQGLAAAATNPGTITLYATAAGGVVNEASAARSPFVSELVPQIGTDQTVDQAFATTRDAVAKKTRNGQVPAIAQNLDETFSFDPDRRRVAMTKKKPDEKADDQATKDQATKDQAAKDQASRDQAARDKAARDQDARDQSARDQTARDQAARDQTAKDKAVRDQEARDQATRDEATRTAARAFNAAVAKGTKTAYEAFLDAHPTGALADKAHAAIARIEADERQVAMDYDEAQAKGTKAAFESFLDRNPNGPMAEKARAEIDRLGAPTGRRKGQEDERRAALDARIASNPRDEAAYYERGQFFAQSGDAPAAIADFDQAIRLNPSSPEAFNNRCWMRAVTNDLKRAIADCNAALKLRPGFIDALDSRGLVNLKSGAFRAAITDYDAALKADPSHSSALYGRGFARQRLGDRAQADKDIATALELNPQIDKEFAGHGLR